jgi:hypothetical protein
MGWLSKLLGREPAPLPPIEDRVPHPTAYVRHDLRIEARIPELVAVIKQNPDDPRVPEWRHELECLVKFGHVPVNPKIPVGVSVDADAAQYSADPV